MGQVKAVSEIDIVAAPSAVFEAVADYTTVRPAILPENYRDYAVVQGGQGDGTIVRWTLQATKKRARHVEAAVTADADAGVVTETDANSTLVTTWTVRPVGEGARVTVETTWAGAGGIGGVFEGIFAPLGLRKIQEQTLSNLAKHLRVAR